MTERKTERWRGRAKEIIEADEEGSEMLFDTIEDAADAAGVSHRTMGRWLQDGQYHNGLMYRYAKRRTAKEARV